VDEDHARAGRAGRAHGESYFERVSIVLADDRSAGLAGAESGETIERCAIPLDLLIEALSNEFAEADTNRIPMTSGDNLLPTIVYIAGIVLFQGLPC
jgi:hypothetical protein